MNSFYTSLGRNIEGSVYVEALSMLPVLLILWIGVLFTYHLDDAEQQSRLAARQCAWEYTEGNCENVPPSCKETPESGGAMEDDTEIKTKLEQAGENREKDSNKISDMGSSIAGIIGDIFGAPVTIKDSRSVSIPGRFGGGTAKKTTSYYLLCNEKEVNFLDKALELAGTLASDIW